MENIPNPSTSERGKIRNTDKTEVGIGIHTCCSSHASVTELSIASVTFVDTLDSPLVLSAAVILCLSYIRSTPYMWYFA